jgi:aminopeptidase
MKDPRIEKLADILVNYSVKVRAGDKVLIQSSNVEPLLVRALIRAVYGAGGMPFVWLADKTIERELLLGATEEQLRLRAENDTALMSRMDCYIGFTAPQNMSALRDVSAEQMRRYEQLYTAPVHLGERLEKTRWVVLRYPTPAMAQAADMSEEAFEDFFFDVCTLDYGHLARALAPLKDLLELTDRVRILSPPTALAPGGTDLSFSIKGMAAIPCCGEKNIPDGEIYTAPVRDSVNGTISYNTASLHTGFLFERVSFTFQDGKIIRADGSDTGRINSLLDADEGARYVGEFALGVNPRILSPMRDTLFDEKIAGSIHFTPGNAYADCDNGNHSSLHWDLVLIQRSDWGGGEIRFDDVLVRKDGIFVLPELRDLNGALGKG